MVVSFFFVCFYKFVKTIFTSIGEWLSVMPKTMTKSNPRIWDESKSQQRIGMPSITIIKSYIHEYFEKNYKKKK